MALPTVHIRKEVFLIIAWAATETFKKECLGSLLGYVPTKKSNILRITEVVPFQSVRRRRNIEVLQSKRGEKRYKDFKLVFNSAGLQILGDFHSHPEWGDQKPLIGISEGDIEDMKKDNADLEIIVTVSSRKRGQALWEILSDGSIKGSWNGFNFRFDAYTIIGESDEKKPHRLSIVKPSVATLNSIFAS